MPDLFDGKTEPTVDPNVDYLEELVGDHKKFKSPQELAKGKFLADQYIEQLRREKDALEQELNTHKGLKSFKDEIKAIKSGTGTEPPRDEDTTPPKKAEVDASDIESVIERLLAKREGTKKAESNLDRVTRVLTEQLGDQAKVALQNKAKEVGLSLSDLQDIGIRSPDALFRMVGVDPDAKKQSFTPTIPGSTVRTESVTGKGNSFYEELKRKDWKRYNSPEIEKQMMKDMERLGIEQYYAS